MAKNKTVFRIKKTDNFVIISRYLLEDERLSYEARGLLACMLAKPNDWTFYISFFITNSPAGRDKVRTIFRELVKFGYIVKSEARSQKGQFSTHEYIVYESPLSCLPSKQGDDSLPKPEKPSTDSSSTVSPATANRPY